MIATAQPVDHRVDLDRIDARGAPLQGATDVVPRPGANHEDLGEGWRPASRLNRCGSAYAGNALSRELICWWPIRFTVMKRGSSA